MAAHIAIDADEILLGFPAAAHDVDHLVAEPYASARSAGCRLTVASGSELRGGVGMERQRRRGARYCRLGNLAKELPMGRYGYGFCDIASSAA